MSRVAVSFNWPLMGLAVASSLGTGYGIGALSHMHAIIALQQNARSEIAASTSNNSGHRDRGLTLTEKTIAEVNESADLAAH